MSNQIWTYYGVDVFPADWNAYGWRWTALCGIGCNLRAGSKGEMRELIRGASREPGFNGTRPKRAA